MQEGTVPKSLKHALVTPILKKDGMDPNILSNFRPVSISNFACLTKILEKAINNRLDGYLTANKLYDPLQSAYRKQTCMVCIFVFCIATYCILQRWRDYYYYHFFTYIHVLFSINVFER